jgi:shikimate kinase
MKAGSMNADFRPADLRKVRLKTNVVFIGMPGCGKTVVSQRAAAALGQPWYDSDLEIEARQKTSISRIFAEKGEDYFRCLESQCIADLLSRGPALIALGGGAVLRNGSLMKKNAAVIYVSRSLESITATLQTEFRPLLAGKSGPEALAVLQALDGQRRRLYESLRDVTIDNEGSLAETVGKVLSALEILEVLEICP